MAPRYDPSHYDLSAFDHGFVFELTDTKDGHLGVIDNGRPIGRPGHAIIGNRKCTSC